MGGNNRKKSFFIFTFVTRIHFQTNPDIQNNLSKGPAQLGRISIPSYGKSIGMERLVGGWVSVGWREVRRQRVGQQSENGS